MNKYRVRFKHCVVYPSTLTSGIGATYIDVDEIYVAASNTNIYTLIYTRYNVVGSIMVEQIQSDTTISNYREELENVDYEVDWVKIYKRVITEK